MKNHEGVESGMTNAQLNAFLEQLAKLSKAITVADAAELVRQAKTE